MKIDGIEIWEVDDEYGQYALKGFYFIIRDKDPKGPFDSYDDALNAAREENQ